MSLKKFCFKSRFFLFKKYFYIIDKISKRYYNKIKKEWIKSLFFYFATFVAFTYSSINVDVSGAGFLNVEEPKLTTVQTSSCHLSFNFI